MITPPYLQKGDTIVILSTARKISMEEINPAVKKLEEWGLKVKIGATIGAEENQMAGSDELKIEDFNNALSDPNIKAILCARGGYGTVRIIDHLDLNHLKDQPKWIIGYSDITVLHNHINRNCEVETLHATMPINFPKDGANNNATLTLKNALFGSPESIEATNSSLNKEGTAEGELIGGNLSIIYSLLGSPSQIETEGKILILEDLDEYLYHIDRMMQNLDRSGLFKGLSGLLIGGMSDMNDNVIPFGKSAVQIIKETVDKYDFPIAFNVPLGHIEDNRAMYMGRKIKMVVTNTTTILSYNS